MEGNLNNLLELPDCPDFATQLRRKIVNPNSAPERFTISPERAEIMLQWNDRNRPISTFTWKRYVAEMKAGCWIYTGEPIIFSCEHLIDGQHRLLACIKSGVSFDALVVFGAPDNAFAVIDVGKTRSAGDVFAIHGVINGRALVAALQWVIGYYDGLLDMGGQAALATGQASHNDLWDELALYPDLAESLPIGRIFGRNKIAASAISTGMHYICARQSRVDADHFFRTVAEGIGLNDKDDPAFRLRRALLESATTHRKLGRKQQAALFIKAWNSYRREKPLGKLSYSVSESFPKAI